MKGGAEGRGGAAARPRNRREPPPEPAGTATPPIKTRKIAKGETSQGAEGGRVGPTQKAPGTGGARLHTLPTVKVITTRLLSEELDCSIIISQTQMSCIINTEKQASRYKPDAMILYDNLTEDINNLLINLDMVMLRAELS